MTPQQIGRVKELLTTALGRPEADREPFLAEVCADDEVVLGEVLSLLAQEDVAAPILDRPVLAWIEPSPEGLSAAPLPIEVGTRIGPYLVVGLLGEGGMGIVALAQREDDYEQRVALKVIRPDGVSDSTLRRFDNERRLLARLEHPNIARILDGGTTDDGRPYFVMEYVEGLPLDVYCKRHDLGIGERLKIFLQVCAAVQTAHQSLIVHRDLKPSNVLVTAAGIPKLLDFGIAKRLDAETTATMTMNGAPLTLGYASPEQVDPHPDRPLTTATDVYSLGVILFELLTGQRPCQPETDSFAALVRAVCQEEAPPPSTVVGEGKRTPAARRLAGDLDAIVGRTLFKEARKRYPSVEKFAADIRRHLDGLPVEARRGTFTYRAGKFLRRHRGKVAAALLVSLTAMGVTVSSTNLRRQAEVEKERSEDVLTFMKKLFKEAKPDRRGPEVTALELLAFGEESVAEEYDPRVQAEILNTIGEVYTSLTEYEAALPPRQRALKILREQSPKPDRSLAKGINNLATNLYLLKRYDEAEHLFREALSMKDLLDDEDTDITKSITNLATVLKSQKKYPEAEHLYREALAFRRAEESTEEAERKAEEAELAKSLRSLANLLYTVGDYEEAESLAREALEIRLRINDPEDTQIALVSNTLGRVLHAEGHLTEAQKYYDLALGIHRRVRGEDHQYTAGMKSNLASLSLDRGDLDTAESLLHEALGILTGPELAEAHSVLGGLRALQGRFAEAEPLLRAGLAEIIEARGEEATQSRRARERLAWLDTGENTEEMNETSGRQNAGHS